MLPPIMVTGHGDVQAKVGDTLVVTGDGVTQVRTDNARILEVSQPYATKTAKFNGGAKTISTGTAHLYVIGANGQRLYKAKIIVS